MVSDNDRLLLVTSCGDHQPNKGMWPVAKSHYDKNIKKNDKMLYTSAVSKYFSYYIIENHSIINTVNICKSNASEVLW